MLDVCASSSGDMRRVDGVCEEYGDGRKLWNSSVALMMRLKVGNNGCGLGQVGLGWVAAGWEGLSSAELCGAVQSNAVQSGAVACASWPVAQRRGPHANRVCAPIVHLRVRLPCVRPP